MYLKNSRAKLQMPLPEDRDVLFLVCEDARQEISRAITRHY